jgi:hypothetical protein
VDDAAGLLERAYRRFEELRPTLTPERLNTLLTLHAIGRTFTLPRWAMLRHVVTHSTYHRGQIASKLKRFGIEQPNTDFFFWAIEQVPQGGRKPRPCTARRSPAAAAKGGSDTAHEWCWCDADEKERE